RWGFEPASARPCSSDQRLQSNEQRPCSRSRATRLLPLLTEKRAIDLLGDELDVSGADPSAREVLAPTGDDLRHAPQLRLRRRRLQAELAGHRERIVERRVSAVGTDSQLLIAERLSRRQH